jgi:hypothetical protein
MYAVLAEGIGDGDVSWRGIGFDARGPTGPVIGHHVAKNSGRRLFDQFIAGWRLLERDRKSTGVVATSVRFILDGCAAAESRIRRRGSRGCLSM